MTPIERIEQKAEQAHKDLDDFYDPEGHEVKMSLYSTKMAKKVVPKKCKFLLCKDGKIGPNASMYCMDHKTVSGRYDVLTKALKKVPECKIQSTARIKLVGIGEKKRLRELLEAFGVDIESVKE